MAAKLEGASRGSSTYKFEGDEISALAESPQLVRWEQLDIPHVEWLATQIAKEGQLHPVVIRRSASGRPELVAGRHRRAAVLKINEDPSVYGLPGPVPLLAIYKDLSDEDAIRASFAENTGKPLTVMDLAQACAQFARLEWDNKKIAAIISTPHHRVSPMRVSQLRSLIRLPHSVQRALHTGKLPESAARAMLQMGIDSTEMERIAGQLESGEIKGSDLTAQNNQDRREKGKKIKRTIKDVRDLLERMVKDYDSDKAVNMLSWLDGEVKEDDKIEEIFK